MKKSTDQVVQELKSLGFGKGQAYGGEEVVLHYGVDYREIEGCEVYQYSEALPSIYAKAQNIANAIKLPVSVDYGDGTIFVTVHCNDGVQSVSRSKLFKPKGA